jgi:hypothetical protein
LLECWIRPEDTGVERRLADPAIFWRSTKRAGSSFCAAIRRMRKETVPPGTIIDTTLPIWRLGEGLLHAARAAKALRHDDEGKITIRFRPRYSGLSGRILRSLSATAVGLILEAQAAKGDEAVVETTLPAHEIEGDLTSAV